MRLDLEERRAAWELRADPYRVAGKVFKDIKSPSWREAEREIEALYPERGAAEENPDKPKRSQLELYADLVRTGRLRAIERTRHEREAVDFDAAKRLLAGG